MRMGKLIEVGAYHVLVYIPLLKKIEEDLLLGLNNITPFLKSSLIQS